MLTRQPLELRMMLRGAVLLASTTTLMLALARGGETTAPVDGSKRNTEFTPTAAAPAKIVPSIDHAIQDRRVEMTTRDKPAAAIGDRRAAIDVAPAREKIVK